MQSTTLDKPPGRSGTSRSFAAAVDTMRQGIGVMVAFTLVASAVNYASNIVFSRLLDPTGFGELTALLALAIIVVVPTGAAQTVIAERVAVHAAERGLESVRWLVRHAVAHVVVIAAAVGVVYAISIPLVIDALDLRQPGPAIALGAFIVLAFLQPIALGVLQGLDRFRAFGAMQLAVAVSRIAFGVPWVLAGGGAGGAIAGQGFGVAVVLIGTAWLLRDLLPGRGTGAASAGLRRLPDVRTVAASTAFIGFAVLSNLDLLLAKLFLAPADVGIYAAIATVGKVVLFLPAAIAVVLVPNAARAHRSSGDSARVLRMAALLVGGTAAIAAVPAALAPDLVVSLMFGASYEAAAGGVLPIVIAGAGLAMLNLLVVYSIAISDRRWSMLLGLGVVLQIVGISLFHDSPTQVAVVQAVVGVLVLLVNEVAFHSLVLSRRSGSG